MLPLVGRGIETATEDEVGKSAALGFYFLLLLHFRLLLVLLVDWGSPKTVERYLYGK